MRVQDYPKQTISKINIENFINKFDYTPKRPIFLYFYQHDIVCMGTSKSSLCKNWLKDPSILLTAKTTC